MVTHNEGNNVEETVALLQEAVAIATKVHGAKSPEAEQYRQFLMAIKEQAAELQVRTQRQKQAFRGQASLLTWMGCRSLGLSNDSPSWSPCC
jgi:hypothetical protein